MVHQLLPIVWENRTRQRKEAARMGHGNSKKQVAPGNTECVNTELEANKYSTLKLILADDFAMAAYIIFLRNEEHSDFSNYFREMNFLKIGEEDYDISDADNKSEDPSPYAEEYFRFVPTTVKNAIFSYKGGDVTPFLFSLAVVSAQVLLLVLVETLERFQQSASYKQWFEREKTGRIENDSCLEHINRLFSSHMLSFRTLFLKNFDSRILKPLLDSRDWLYIIKTCLLQMPIATVMCRYNSKGDCEVVSSNEAYCSMFFTSAGSLYNKRLNLLQMTDRVSRAELQAVISRQVAQKWLIPITIGQSCCWVAVASVPITGQCGRTPYMVFVCCNTSLRSFTMEELKIISDFADILPRKLALKREVQQRKLFAPPPIEEDTEVPSGLHSVPHEPTGSARSIKTVLLSLKSFIDDDSDKKEQGDGIHPGPDCYIMPTLPLKHLHNKR
jgi:hypothetical protein